MTTQRLFVLCLSLVTAFSGLRGGAAQPSAGQLLVEPPPGAAAPGLAAAVAARDTVRGRAIVVNLAALDGDLVDVSVTPDVALRARLTRRTLNPDGSESWSGDVVDAPLSAATFVRAGSILQGSLRTLTGAYSIEPLGASGLHVVREVDPQAMGDELLPLVPDPQAVADALTDTPPIAGDDGGVFDLLVVYTPAARAAAGGTDAAIQARINLGVSETNTAYANSGIIPRIRLVGAEPVSYTESGDLSSDLNYITGTADGRMDAVHARRNALGADLVKLVVGEAAGGACGVAWLMDTLSAGFATNAFSVTAYPCISPNYTFGHELGHNMGSNHAPEDGASGGLYAYSYGYKHPGNVFRTVMAYNCAAGCPRVLYFSNPSVLYNGLPTGTAAQHNNALSINSARSTVANWRQAVSTNTAPTISSIANRITAEDTPTPAIGFTVGDGQTAAGSLVVTATSSNPAVVGNTNAALALGGSGANRTLVVTPQPNASGTTVISVIVSDGAQSASSAFQLTVTAVNDGPAISAVASQTTNEDQGIAIPFTVSDAETAAGSLTVQATSSNTALVAAAGIGLGGSGGSRLVTLTPVANASGVTTITLLVSDGSVTAQTSFVLTVSAVNDAPIYANLPPLVSTTRNAPTSFNVTVSDPDSPGSGLTLSIASISAVLLPPSGIVVTATASTASTRTFRVTLTPATGQVGTTTLTLTAGDGSATSRAPVAFSVTAVASAPNPPTAVTATATGLSVTISWRPALTGSAPTSFSIELGTSPGTTTLPIRSVPWPTMSLTLSLPAGRYYARVRAVNGIGPSSPSPESSVEVTEGSPIPGPPANFYARTVGRTVSFTWNASVTGAAATSYVIEAGSGPGVANIARFETGTPATGFDVPNVPAGTYWVRVRGANAAGSGAPSQDVAIVMSATGGCVGLPGAPVLLTPVVSGTNVVLSWNAPATGAMHSGYVLMAGSQAGTANLAHFSTGGTGTSFAASAPPGLYFVRIAAANACGVGPASNEVSFALGAGRPDAPRNLLATVSGAVVSLTWSAPPSGPAPSSYLVEAGSAAGLADLAIVSTGSASPSLVAEAPPGAYFVRVRAVNGAGPGPATADLRVIVP